MSAQVFSESGQMEEVDITEIFDVLEGGEDEGAVKYLLGFGGNSSQNESTSNASTSTRMPRDSLKASFACNSCGKMFTTKFNLKRHINMHCHQSKELGVPIQGPPSASAPPSKKNKPMTTTLPTQRSCYNSNSSSNVIMTLPQNLSFQTAEGATVSLGLPDQQRQSGVSSRVSSRRSPSPFSSSSSSVESDNFEEEEEEEEKPQLSQPVVADSISVTVNLDANELGCVPLQMPAICGEDVRQHLFNRRLKRDNESHIEASDSGNRKKRVTTIHGLPEGWKRRVVGKRAFYFNMAGKKFESMEQVRVFLNKLGYVIADESVFDFGKEPEETYRESMPMPKRGSEESLDADNSLSKDDGSMLGGGGDRAASPNQGAKPIKRRRVDPQQQMQWLYDFLRRFKREDGGEICEPFIRAPKRRSDPKYYEIVRDPIDMLRIQQKLRTDEYNDLAEITEDFNRLIDNALKYYDHMNSQPEKEAALEMKSLLDRALAKIEMGEDPNIALGDREGDNNELFEMADELLGAVMTATDPSDSDRLLHNVFRLLPSQKRYPEYYEVITEPMDLKTIACRIENGAYESLSAVDEDLNLVFKNAMSFNEPGSQIYRDAKHLMKVVKSKKLEIEANKLSELSYEDSESEESEEDDVPNTDDPLWELYSYVRNYESPVGTSLGEPFFSLPSKRELPEYYNIIANPISLNLIRKKLKNGDYGDLGSLASEMNLMFENCKQYNRPESRLYKDGAKLQRAMNLKLQELESGIKSEASDETRLPQSPVRKRMRGLYNAVLNYRTKDGIQLVGMFMEKPDKNDYPDYYEIISTPMDMNTINERIKNGHYKTEDDLMADMRLMFSNCRRYNEEGSDIYDDSLTLEKALMSKAKELGLQVARRGKTMKKSAGSVALNEKLRTLYETLRDHRDGKGRQLSLIFLKLPNPKEFPDYFEVIKNPIDFERISAKMKQNAYDSLDACLSDFTLVFDNACKYNEPDSQIYKDSLTLQSLAHRTCRSLNEEDASSVPDVQAAVQDILNFIFTSMYNAQDSDERCLSDSLAELPEHDEIDGRKVRALSLDLIKRRLDRALYKRLDTFQKDVFAVFERARQLTRSDSQIFEDAIELQTKFIRLRDEACENGDVLQSRALLYGVDELRSSVDVLREQKKLNELPEETEENTVKEESTANGCQAAFFGDQQEQYRVGEFVYVDHENNGSKAIMLIENIIQDDNNMAKDESETNKGSNNGIVIRGNSFYRPVETFHVSSRKFIENEVFRTDQHLSFTPDKIKGRCIVVPIRDFFRSIPQGFDSNDVYVCESRYSVKARSFKKMKMAWEIPSFITMEPRAEAYEPKRVMSVFKARIEKHKEELEEIEAMVNNVDENVPPNVLWMNPEGQPGLIYYEQYTIPGPITLRRGDTVYVRAENGKSLIAQIDTMWTADDGMAHFHGPWFVTPKEMTVGPEAMFYKQEAFLSTISDTNPLLSVVGKCVVMEMNDYTASRPTQYAEADVYVCESVYDESKRCVRGQLPEGLKQYEYSTAVTTDEIFFFKTPLCVKKESLALGSVNTPIAAPGSPSKGTLPTTPKTAISIASMEIDNEDSLDAPPSVASSDTAPAVTPASTKKVKGTKRMITPYILYSSEVRRGITEENKSCTFGEISRLVADRKVKNRNGYSVYSSEAWPKVKMEMPKSATFAEMSRQIGNQWRQLTDTERQAYEEKSKRINEENALKHAEELRLAEERRKNEAATPKVTPPPIQPAVNGPSIKQPQPPLTPGAVSPGLARPPSQPGQLAGRGAEPIFHTVPPRPQRLLHSEAYIRYIEGLSSDSQNLSNWERQLNASKSNTRVDEAKLPAHWLADNGDHGTSLDALWALRDFMMGDALHLYRTNKIN